MPGRDNEKFTTTALPIARAPQLCCISTGDLSSFIEERVDGFSKHFVVDVGSDGEIYENPV